MIPTSKDFQEQLDKVLTLASRQGRPHIDITAGALHRLVWGAYERRHRLPQCCYVMKKTMREGDIMALRCLMWKRLLTLINITGNTEPPTFSAELFAAQQLYKKALGRSNSSLPQVR